MIATMSAVHSSRLIPSPKARMHSYVIAGDCLPGRNSQQNGTVLDVA